MKINFVYKNIEKPSAFTIDFYSATQLFTSSFENISLQLISNCWKKVGIFKEDIPIPLSSDSVPPKSPSFTFTTLPITQISPSPPLKTFSLPSPSPSFEFPSVSNEDVEEESEVEEDGYQKLPPSTKMEMNIQRKKINESNLIIGNKLKTYNLRKGSTIGDGVCLIYIF
jgi:hypothetical protein